MKGAEEEPPSVSVAMPVYNAARHLRDALDSILAQTMQDFEIVAVNDGSADDSGKILDEYAAQDGRIRVIHRPNGGCGAARNSAIRLARGRYVAAQDADDISMPDRLERQAAFLDAHPDVAAVFSRTVSVDSGLRPAAVSLTPLSHRKIARALAGRNILQPNFMIRKTVLDEIGGYREAFTCSQDYDFYLRAAERGKIVCLPQPLYLYRRHEGQTSSARRDEQNSFGSLARAFGCERRRTGRDSYAEFAKAGGVPDFVRTYEFRALFLLIAGFRCLKRLDIAPARNCLKAALRERGAKIPAAALLAKSYVPRSALRMLYILRTRILKRSWTTGVPRHILEFTELFRRRETQRGAIPGE